MIMLQKQLVVAGIFLCACLVLITSEGERKAEFEQKETVARDPQGNVVPLSDIQREKVAQRIPLLPTDVQAHVASFLESDQYVLWKTFTTSGEQLAFRDNGQNLVSLQYMKAEKKILVTIRNMSNGFVQQFTILSPDGKQLQNVLLSTDGTTIVALTDTGTTMFVWNTVDPGIKKRIAMPKNISGWSMRAINNDGTQAVIFQNNPLSYSLFNLQKNTFTALFHTPGIPFPVFYTFQFSPDNKTILGRSGASITFWNADDGTYQGSKGLQVDSGSFRAVALNNDSTIAAVITNNNIILLHHSQDRYHEQSSDMLAGADDQIRNAKLLFSHDNKKLVFLIDKEEVFGGLWDVATEDVQEIGTASMDWRSVNVYFQTCAFTPDDTILALIVQNGIQLWKKSNPLQNELQKQRAIRNLRARRTTQRPLPQRSNASVSTSSTSLMEQSTQESGESLKMDEPD